MVYAGWMTWNEGFTKKTHAGVKKISDTMKARKIDNFREWRDKHPVHYAAFERNGDLAEYIGAVLGDGHIEKFPRTERITIAGDVAKPKFIARYAALTEILFQKKPVIEKELWTNGLRLSLYQKHISGRLGIPTGNKRKLAYKLPEWIAENDEYLLRFLRGLFEADGYLSIHFPTSTYNFAFVNYNKYLLDIVENALIKLEFHPEVRHNAIRIRRKAEVERLKKLMRFREYD